MSVFLVITAFGFALFHPVAVSILWLVSPLRLTRTLFTTTDDQPCMYPSTSQPPPTKASLKAWWNHFTFTQRAKKEAEAHKAEEVQHTVFGKTLKESLTYASVQISTANANGELYVWGYIPVVVAKCGLYLKENATEVEGTFRVNGSNKRMRELQALFEAPPRYGRSLDWNQESYTTHDVASVFRRYLTQMPEPVIPHDLYHDFRDALSKKPFNQDEVIATYKRLLRSMPRANQYLLLYVLDLLSVFARRADKNLMNAANLAVIFRPGLISHPKHEMSPQEHQLSQEVLEFLIAQQDWFMLDIPPPPQSALISAEEEEGEDFFMVPSSDEDNAQPGSWKLVGKERRKVVRRRTADKDTNAIAQKPSEGSDLSPVAEVPPSPIDGQGATGVTRRRTLPSSHERGDSQNVAPERAKVLRKQKRTSTSQPRSGDTARAPIPG